MVNVRVYNEALNVASQVERRERLHFLKMVLYLIRTKYMEESLMLDAPVAAEKFLNSMLETDKQHLFNALLGLDTTHNLNRNTSFYSYRNLKKILHPKQSKAMQSLHFSNQLNEELVVRQLKDHSFLKNSYRIEIILNSQIYDYQLINCLLEQLYQCCCADVYSYA